MSWLNDDQMAQPWNKYSAQQRNTNADLRDQIETLLCGWHGVENHDGQPLLDDLFGYTGNHYGLVYAQYTDEGQLNSQFKKLRGLHGYTIWKAMKAKAEV